MKSPLILSALCLCLVATLCKGDESNTDKIKELEEQMATLQKEKAVLAEEVARRKTEASEASEIATPSELIDKDGKINPRISNAVLIIEGDLGVGTGFVAAVDGKKYLYTAAHVFSGNSKLTIKNTGGISFKKFGALEAAEGADLIRMEILEEVKDFLEIYPADAELPINTPIAALGNGGGTGVVAVEKGRILGTSADSLEVDAGIIQGNSGGPVVDRLSGRAVGVVTHLRAERKDVWSEGTRQAEVRRFAVRLNRSWKWKATNIGSFLAEGKALAEFDELTRLGFAMAQLEPLTNGMRLDQNIGGGSTAMEILQKNQANPLVRSLIQMNGELAARKTSLSTAELKKKFRSLLGQVHSQAIRSNDAFKPQSFAWFHRSRSAVSVKARKECLDSLSHGLDALK